MPDTRRTPAEILALFPDNTSGEISPQDQRDFVVSTMVDPNADVFVLLRDEAGSDQIEAVYAQDFPLTGTAVDPIPAGSGTVFVKLDEDPADNAFSFRFDPQGWLRDASYVSSWWEGTFPAGTVMELPPGRYLWSLRLTYKRPTGAAPAGTEAVQGVWFDADQPAALGAIEDTYGIAAWAFAPNLWRAEWTEPPAVGTVANANFTGFLEASLEAGTRRISWGFNYWFADPQVLKTIQLRVTKVA